MYLDSFFKYYVSSVIESFWHLILKQNCALLEDSIKHIMSHTLLSPDHTVNNVRVGLDNFDHFSADVFIYVVRNGGAVMTVTVHFYGGVNGLKKRGLIYTGQEEAGFVQGFRALRTGADADGGEWMADGGEEAALLGQGAGV